MIDNERIKTIFDSELNELRHVAKVFSKNTHRALRLLRFSFKSNEQIEDKRAFLEFMNDVARATVVLLHSSLETMLREIIRMKLKSGADISYIPLAEQSGFPNRREKFTLKDLSRQRGKTVDEVINNSIDEYLSGLSFNSGRDISDTLTRIDLPQSTLGNYYSGLDEMISRRHQIVHEADLKREQQQFNLEPITIEQVGAWEDNCTRFSAEIIRLITDAVYVDRIAERLKALGIQMSRAEIMQSIEVGITIND